MFRSCECNMATKWATEACHIIAPIRFYVLLCTQCRQLTYNLYRAPSPLTNNEHREASGPHRSLPIVRQAMPVLGSGAPPDRGPVKPSVKLAVQKVTLEYVCAV